MLSAALRLPREGYLFFCFPLPLPFWSPSISSRIISAQSPVALAALTGILTLFLASVLATVFAGIIRPTFVFSIALFINIDLVANYVDDYILYRVILVLRLKRQGN